MTVATPPSARARRLRSPLLVILAALLAFESVGGLVIFYARLVSGSTPGEAAHVITGAMLAAIYAVYQWQHWSRVAPFRGRLDYALGLLAALSMLTALGTGLALALPWWEERVTRSSGAAVGYAPGLSAEHNIASMLVLTFVGAHLAAVLLRDRRVRA